MLDKENMCDIKHHKNVSILKRKCWDWNQRQNCFYAFKLPPATPLRWESLNPAAVWASSELGVQQQTLESCLITFMWVSTDPTSASTRDAPVVLPSLCQCSQRANMVLSSVISNLSNLSVCWPRRISSFPPSVGCSAQGYSMLWQHRMQFCSLLPHFCIAKKITLVGQTTAASRSKFLKPTIFLTLGKKLLSECMFSWL